MTTTEWVDVGTLSDAVMAGHAKARRLVKMDDGRIARLVSWPAPWSKSGTRGRTCVVEWMSGKRYRLPTHRVDQVAI